jgi:hypothetical protein
MEAYQDSGLVPSDPAAGSQRMKLLLTRGDALAPHPLDLWSRPSPLDGRTAVA